MRRTAPLLGLAAALLLTGCPPDAPSCSPELERAAVVDLARSWYLYPALLPAQIDPGAYDSTQALLDALTAEARAQGMDRGWSFVTTIAEQAQRDAGGAVGLGVGLLVRDTRLFVSQVYPASAADEAGFVRGDEILAIGEAEPLTPVADLLATDALGAALGPSTAGVTRTFEVQPVAGGSPTTRTVTKRGFDLDPVPATQIVDRAGLSPAGYVALRTFIPAAETRLQEAFAAFQAAGVTDVVVDLRYNGGGSLATARLLADLLAGDLAGDVMYDLENNPAHALFDEEVTFAPPAAALAPLRVAFVTTGSSASASELVPNALEPWRSVALVGARTYGKPVGQYGFGIQSCDTLVFLVAFRLRNVQGDGDFFDGLPDPGGNFSGPLCEAPDDLLHDPSDPAEASTAAALAWLETGACPLAPVAPIAPARAAPDRYPVAPAPSLAQRNVRGLF